MDKNDIRRMLEEEGVPFDIFDHPAVYTVEEAATLFLPADAMMEIQRIFLRLASPRTRAYRSAVTSSTICSSI